MFGLRSIAEACYLVTSPPAHPLCRKGSSVAFRKGDTVVHPEHGAAVIQELREKEFLGEKRTYLVLRVAYGDLTLLIPVDSTEQVGLRQVVSKNEVKKVLKVLTEDESSMAANWSRRFKNNMEKLHSGDPYQVAEVLRNLAIREREKGLSAGEKRMILKARQILISELSYATAKTEDEAETHDRRGPGRRPRRQDGRSGLGSEPARSAARLTASFRGSRRPFRPQTVQVPGLPNRCLLGGVRADRPGRRWGRNRGDGRAHVGGSQERTEGAPGRGRPFDLHRPVRDRVGSSSVPPSPSPAVREPSCTSSWAPASAT